MSPGNRRTKKSLHERTSLTSAGFRPFLRRKIEALRTGHRDNSIFLFLVLLRRKPNQNQSKREAFSYMNDP